MAKPRSYSIAEVFDSTRIALTFEFYSSKLDQFMVKELSSILGQHVYLTGDGDYQPTYTSSVLLKEYNSKRPRFQLKVGPRSYNNLNPNLRTLLMWINEHGSLDYSTNLKTNLTFEHKELQTIRSISNMDIGKMVLKLDENWLYERFPEAKKSPFSLSIKRLVPLGNFINASSIVRDLNTVFRMPMNEYYGVDFTNYIRGTLGFNYICGSNYTEKPDTIEEVLKYYVMTTYQVLNETDFPTSQMKELQRLTEDYQKLRNLYYNPEKFQKAFENIKLFIDLENHPEIIKAKWSQIRDPLFKIIFESGFDKGSFNWDSEFGNYQIKDAKLSNTVVENFEVINCELDACVLKDIHGWKNTINNSRIMMGTLLQSNIVNESYLENIRIDRNNKINKCYIINSNNEIINCKVNESIIKYAGIGKDAKLSEDSIIVAQREEQPKMIQGIQVKELRDYKWIKNLTGEKKDKGFANEYKTDY